MRCIMCDRCGKFIGNSKMRIADDDPTADVVIFMNKETSSFIKTGGYRVDLCGDCRESFGKWWTDCEKKEGLKQD